MNMDSIFQINSDSEFRNVIQDIISNLFNTHTCNEYEEAKNDIKKIILETNCECSQLNECLSLKSYDKGRISFFQDLLESRKKHLIYLTYINHNSTYGETVAHFDWIIKLVYGTSELKNLKYPLLQLHFNTYKNGEESQKTFDISKDMLGKLISTLEAVESECSLQP